MHGKIRKQKLVQKNLTEKELKHETENVIKLFCSSAEHLNGRFRYVYDEYDGQPRGKQRVYSY